MALALALVALLVVVLASGSPEAADATGRPLLARVLLRALALVAGERAAAALGVLALAAAAVVAGAELGRRIGDGAPLLVALFVFGSTVWAATWASGAELVSLALATAAFALAYGGGPAADEPPGEIYQPEETAGRGTLRWLGVGLLLGELVPSSPLLAALLVPAALAVPPAERRRGTTALLGAWAAAAAVETVVQGPAALLAPLADAFESFRFSPALAGWNLVYLVAGRNVGLVAGFAPLVLLLWLGRDGAGRRGLALVCLLLPLATAVFLPFDFAAGWLNLFFLPLYGALWLLPARPPRMWEWLATVVLCALVSWPFWTPPWAAAAGGAGLVSGWPRSYLPYETTLRSLPAAGPIELGRSDLRARAVRGSRFVSDADRFELVGSETVEIWLAAPVGLELAALEFGPGAPSTLEVGGAEAGRTVFRPDGRVGFELRLTRPRAQHPLWFGDHPFAVHLIRLRMPEREGGGALRFRLLAAQP